VRDGRTFFRPTWSQALGQGLVLGLLAGGVVLTVTAVVCAAAAVLPVTGSPPGRAWLALVLGPPAVGAVLGAVLARCFATEVDGSGIRLGPYGAPAPWHRVVDLRAERRNSRTVVAVYLDCGAALQLCAPYDGGFLAADPAFERKLVLLSQQWRSHRIGRSISGDPPGAGGGVRRF
jgi:hypothetical protein